MIKTYVFLMDKELSDSRNGIVDASTVIDDFRNAGIQILDITTKVIGIWELMKVKVDLNAKYFRTEVKKFADTKSYRYLW